MGILHQVNLFWIYWFFLRPHLCTILAKLGWWGWLMMRLSWNKSQKTRYLHKTLHWNETKSTTSVDKLNIMDSIPNVMPLKLQTRDTSLPDWPWHEKKSIHRDTAYHTTVGGMDFDVFNVLHPPFCTFITLLAKLGQWGWGWFYKSQKTLDT